MGCGFHSIVSEMKFHLLLIGVAISLGPLPGSEAGVGPQTPVESIASRTPLLSSSR